MYVVEAIHDLSPALFSAGSTTSSLSPSLLRLVDGRSMAVSEERDQRPYKLVRSRTCFANERCRRNWRTREGATLPQLASQTRWLSFSLVALSSPLVVCLQPAAGSDMAASELSLLALQISRASKAPPTDLDCLSPRYLHTRPIGRSVQARSVCECWYVRGAYVLYALAALDQFRAPSSLPGEGKVALVRSARVYTLTTCTWSPRISSVTLNIRRLSSCPR